MLENIKSISRVEQNISLVRFVHSWDILVNTLYIPHILYMITSLIILINVQLFVELFMSLKNSGAKDK